MNGHDTDNVNIFTEHSLALPQASRLFRYADRR